MPLAEILEKQAISKELYPAFFQDGGLASLGLGFQNGGLAAPASPTVGLGGSLGSSLMSTARPSSILGIGRALTPFNPSSYQVSNLGTSYEAGNRAQSTPFRRMFFQETETPALDNEGQPYITRPEIDTLVNEAIRDREIQIASQAPGSGGGFTLRNMRSRAMRDGFSDGGLAVNENEEDIISRLTKVPESLMEAEAPQRRRKAAMPIDAAEEENKFGLESVFNLAQRLANPRLPSSMNPLSDEEVQLSIRPNMPGKMQRIGVSFPFQDGGLVDAEAEGMESDLQGMNLSKEDEDLLKILMVALDEESDLTDEEREVIIIESISRFGEEFVMSLMSSLASSAQTGDGMSDSINARLSHGEYVIPADAVAHAGDGSTEVGARRLRDLVEELRVIKTGTPEQAAALPMAGGGLAKYMYRDGGMAGYGYQDGGLVEEKMIGGRKPTRVVSKGVIGPKEGPTRFAVAPPRLNISEKQGFGPLAVDFLDFLGRADDNSKKSSMKSELAAMLMMANPFRENTTSIPLTVGGIKRVIDLYNSGGKIRPDYYDEEAQRFVRDPLAQDRLYPVPPSRLERLLGYQDGGLVKEKEQAGVLRRLLEALGGSDRTSRKMPEGGVPEQFIPPAPPAAAPEEMTRPIPPRGFIPPAPPSDPPIQYIPFIPPAPPSDPPMEYIPFIPPAPPAEAPEEATRPNPPRGSKRSKKDRSKRYDFQDGGLAKEFDPETFKIPELTPELEREIFGVPAFNDTPGPGEEELKFAPSLLRNLGVLPRLGPKKNTPRLNRMRKYLIEKQLERYDEGDKSDSYSF